MIWCSVVVQVFLVVVVDVLILVMRCVVFDSLRI